MFKNSLLQLWLDGAITRNLTSYCLVSIVPISFLIFSFISFDFLSLSFFLFLSMAIPPPRLLKRFQDRVPFRERYSSISLSLSLVTILLFLLFDWILIATLDNINWTISGIVTRWKWFTWLAIRVYLINNIFKLDLFFPPLSLSKQRETSIE